MGQVVKITCGQGPHRDEFGFEKNGESKKSGQAKGPGGGDE